MIESSLIQQAVSMPREGACPGGGGIKCRHPAFERLSRIGRHLFDVDLCLIMPTTEPHWIRQIGDAINRHGQAFSRLLGRHDVAIVDDLTKIPQLASHPLVTKDPAIRFVAWVDIKGGGGENLSLVLADREPRTWTLDSVGLFEQFLELGADIHSNMTVGQDALALVEENRQLRKMVAVDRMTGLWNRESIFDILEREIERCSRHALPISVIVADLDHFKLINDHYGHLAGDSAIEEVSLRLRNSVRSYDAVGRLGGEEFLIVMSDCNEPVAASIAERIQHLVRHTPVDTAHSSSISVTISQGLVTHTGPDRIAAKELFDRADRALYMAKSLGRDGIQRDTDLI